MSVSPLSFFRMLKLLDWEVIPGVAEKWGASQGTWGSKWEAPYAAGGNWSLVLPVASGTRCGTHPVLPPKGGRMCVLCLHLSSAEICSLEYLFMALWACPPRQSPWEECRLFWKDTQVCARTSTAQTPVAPRRVRTVRCHCFHVSYLISPTHFYLSSFKYNNW